MFLKQLFGLFKSTKAPKEPARLTDDSVFLLADDSCFTHYSSSADAVADIEAPDVHLYRMFKADGRIVQMVVDKETIWSCESVRLVTTDQYDVDGFRNALLEDRRRLAKHPKFVNSLGQHPEIHDDDISLQTLIDLLLQYG